MLQNAFLQKARPWCVKGMCWGVAPSQDASHHQDYEIFLVGDPELNLHLHSFATVTGRGDNPRYVFH